MKRTMTLPKNTVFCTYLMINEKSRGFKVCVTTEDIEVTAYYDENHPVNVWFLDEELNASQLVSARNTQYKGNLFVLFQHKLSREMEGFAEIPMYVPLYVDENNLGLSYSEYDYVFQKNYRPQI